MEDRTRGFLWAVFASVCLSTVPAVVKIGLADGADPLQLLAPRMVLGAALLWLWIGATRPQRLRIDRQGLRNCALAGGINAVNLLLFYLGLRRVGASVAILIFSIYPALLLLLLHLKGESVNRRDLLRLALALGGIYLITEAGGAVDPVGVAYMLACAALYAFYMLVIHSRLVAYPASTTSLWIVTALTGGVLLMRPWVTAPAPLGLVGWGVVAWSAVVGIAIARVATVQGVRLIGGAESALLLPVETVLSVGWAALILGERISTAQMAGAALILTSVLLATALRRPLAFLQR